eukprot:CAMPEP_0206173890 /NCGR_PEP_ID=MMETSP1474-20131121/50455_1 /ASSEMBLY_ACC=CAM_ASM_001110 /TAXON_ID=97495 /ORGANISM="Imantonia sp., Strain RCC918" /LENGTH=193 /DNA_ID=CAMNT_0053583067 /DNA_START=266 /DNA_END=847 /DNA_ORIENTATION=-
MGGGMGGSQRCPVTASDSLPSSRDAPAAAAPPCATPSPWLPVKVVPRDLGTVDCDRRRPAMLMLGILSLIVPNQSAPAFSLSSASRRSCSILSRCANEAISSAVAGSLSTRSRVAGSASGSNDRPTGSTSLSQSTKLARDEHLLLSASVFRDPCDLGVLGVLGVCPRDLSEGSGDGTRRLKLPAESAMGTIDG